MRLCYTVFTGQKTHEKIEKTVVEDLFVLDSVFRTIDIFCRHVKRPVLKFNIVAYTFKRRYTDVFLET